MKKLLAFAMCTLMLIGCRKEHEAPPSSLAQTPEKTLQNAPKCGVELNTEFTAKMMKSRRSQDQQQKLSATRPKESPTLPPAHTLIFLDADGHTVENTPWNWSRTFDCIDAGLTQDQMSLIIKSVTEDFSRYQITVTADENLYNNAPKEKRVRVILTSYEGLSDIFPIAGGYAYIGSLWWKDDTPCFVFANLSGEHTANIAEIVSHEVGHTIGLSHQAEYYPDGRVRYEYHSGFIIDDITWRSIMGSGYSGDISGWMNGRTTFGIQRDFELLSAVGVRADAKSGTFSNAKELYFSNTIKKILFKGLINYSADADFYSLNNGKINFSVTSGGNCDMKVFVYNHNQKVIAEFNDRNSINISDKKIITKGSKVYLKVVASDIMPGVIESSGRYTLVVKRI